APRRSRFAPLFHRIARQDLAHHLVPTCLLVRRREVAHRRNGALIGQNGDLGGLHRCPATHHRKHSSRYRHHPSPHPLLPIFLFGPVRPVSARAAPREPCATTARPRTRS